MDSNHTTSSTNICLKDFRVQVKSAILLTPLLHPHADSSIKPVFSLTPNNQNKVSMSINLSHFCHSVTVSIELLQSLLQKGLTVGNTCPQFVRKDVSKNSEQLGEIYLPKSRAILLANSSELTSEDCQFIQSLKDKNTMASHINYNLKLDFNQQDNTLTLHHYLWSQLNVRKISFTVTFYGVPALDAIEDTKMQDMKSMSAEKTIINKAGFVKSKPVTPNKKVSQQSIDFSHHRQTQNILEHENQGELSEQLCSRSQSRRAERSAIDIEVPNDCRLVGTHLRNLLENGKIFEENSQEEDEYLKSRVSEDRSALMQDEEGDGASHVYNSNTADRFITETRKGPNTKNRSSTIIGENERNKEKSVSDGKGALTPHFEDEKPTRQNSYLSSYCKPQTATTSVQKDVQTPPFSLERSSKVLKQLPILETPGKKITAIKRTKQSSRAQLPSQITSLRSRSEEQIYLQAVINETKKNNKRKNVVKNFGKAFRSHILNPQSIDEVMKVGQIFELDMTEFLDEFERNLKGRKFNNNLVYYLITHGTYGQLFRYWLENHSYEYIHQPGGVVDKESHEIVSQEYLEMFEDPIKLEELKRLPPRNLIKKSPYRVKNR